MAKYSTILFYKFFPVSDPELFRLWQWELCSRLGLKGRIIVSAQGINGTLGGPIEKLKEYRKLSAAWVDLGKLELKWDHGLDEVPFPKLSVKKRNELVTFNWPGLEVDSTGVVAGGEHIGPAEVMALLEKISAVTGVPVGEILGKEVLFLDGRNSYEWEIGHFRNAFDPGVSTAKGFEPLLQSGVLDEWKEKPVITYCTGGIRCEILTPLLKSYGFQNVYQVDGGIVRYLQESGNSDGLWEGALYTFDTRKTVFNGLAEPVSKCCHCGTSTANQENCRSCERQVVTCENCWRTAAHCPDCL